MLIISTLQGNLTSGENIGDSGLITSYRAWKALSTSSTNKADFRLPGLEAFTLDQLFFLAFGRVWATKSLASAAVMRVRTDPHSPPVYRVHGTLSNIPEFATAFNCSAKAKVGVNYPMTLTSKISFMTNTLPTFASSSILSIDAHSGEKTTSSVMFFRDLHRITLYPYNETLFSGIFLGINTYMPNKPTIKNRVKFDAALRSCPP